jgi:predicted DNA-binding WGR domain protein
MGFAISRQIVVTSTKASMRSSWPAVSVESLSWVPSWGRVRAMSRNEMASTAQRSLILFDRGASVQCARRKVVAARTRSRLRTFMFE